MRKEDELKSLFDRLKKMPEVTGLPDDYTTFEERMSNPGVARNFYGHMRENGLMPAQPPLFGQPLPVPVSVPLSQQEGKKPLSVLDKPVQEEQPGIQPVPEENTGGNPQRPLAKIDADLDHFDWADSVYGEEMNQLLNQPVGRRDAVMIRPALLEEAARYAPERENWQRLQAVRSEVEREKYTHPETLAKRKAFVKKTEDTNAVLEEYGKSLRKSQGKLEDLPVLQRMFLRPGIPMYSQNIRDVANEREIAMVEAAQKIYGGTIDLMNAPGRYDESSGFSNTVKGMKDRGTDVDFLTLGATELLRNFQVKSVLEKLGNNEDGRSPEELLTRGENALLEAVADKAMVEMERSGDLSLGYRGGKIGMDVLSGLLEAALVGAATSPVKVVAKRALAKWLVRRTGNKTLARELGKGAVWMANSAIRGATHTFLQPSAYLNVTRKMNEVEQDENGRNKLDERGIPIRKSIGKALREGAVESFIENFANGSAEHIKGTAALAGKTLRGKLPERWNKSLDDFANRLADSPPGEMYRNLRTIPAYRFIEKNVLVKGVEEWSEQWYENALNAVYDHGKSLKDFASVEGQLINLGAMIPSLFGGCVVDGVQVQGAKKCYKDSAEALKTTLSGLGAEAADVRNFLQNPDSGSIRDVSRQLSPLINRVADADIEKGMELYEAVSRFMLDRGKYHIFRGKYSEASKGGTSGATDSPDWNDRSSPSVPKEKQAAVLPSLKELLEQEDAPPVGKSAFGNVYGQFRGDAGQAAGFLRQQGSGQAAGVFHREGIGDIDLVWGDATDGMGLAHILRQAQAGQDTDGLMKQVADVVENGKLVKNGKQRLTLTGDDYRVSLRRNVRPSGSSGTTVHNWVVADVEKVQKKPLAPPPAPERGTIRHFDGHFYSGEIVKRENGRVVIRDENSGREISVPEKQLQKSGVVFRDKKY